jgi:hypothetical protein
MRLLSCFALLTALVAAVLASAQSDPPARPLPGTEALGKYLRELGLEPKPLSPDVFQITVEQDRWPVHIMTSLSTDGRRVWLESKFAPVADPDKVPPAAWKRLLEANEKIGPAHFAFDKSDKRVHLYKSFDSQDLTAERLKREIEHFDTTVRKTQEYWRGENFKAVETVAAPAADPAALPPPPTQPVSVARESTDAEKLIGEWRVAEIRVNGQKTPEDALAARKPGMVIRRGRDSEGKIVAELQIAPDRTRTVILSTVSGPLAPRMDLIDDQGHVESGNYRLEGGTLTLLFGPPGESPSGTSADGDARKWVIVLKKG